jgi:hypothetical protein
MKHPFLFNQFIAMITSHEISECLCGISTGKMERGREQKGRIERDKAMD